jgi:hypothetical protein
MWEELEGPMTDTVVAHDYSGWSGGWSGSCHSGHRKHHHHWRPFCGWGGWGGCWGGSSGSCHSGHRKHHRHHWGSGMDWSGSCRSGYGGRGMGPYGYHPFRMMYGKHFPWRHGCGWC